MSRAVTVFTTLAILAACNGSDGAEPTVAPPTTKLTSTTTTTTVAPTTTQRPTTTSPSTTAPPTTAATTAAPPPLNAGDDDAESEVVARYEEFSQRANECVAAPTKCDLQTALGDIADPDANLVLVYLEWWQQGIDNGWTVQQLDRVKRTINSVGVDRDAAVLVGCVTDGQVVVGPDGAVVDDKVGYRREETIWQLMDNGWRLVGGRTYLTDVEDQICQF